MKINPSQLEQIKKVYQQSQKTNKDSKKDENKRTDKMSISDKAKNIKDVQKSLEQTSDVRKKKVEKLKQAVKNNTYHVDSKAIAEKVINNIDQE